MLQLFLYKWTDVKIRCEYCSSVQLIIKSEFACDWSESPGQELLLTQHLLVDDYLWM